MARSKDNVCLLITPYHTYWLAHFFSFLSSQALSYPTFCKAVGYPALLTLSHMALYWRFLMMFTIIRILLRLHNTTLINEFWCAAGPGRTSPLWLLWTKICHGCWSSLKKEDGPVLCWYYQITKSTLNDNVNTNSCVTFTWHQLIIVKC